MPKLTKTQWLEIRERIYNGERPVNLASRFDVHRVTIYQHFKNNNWEMKRKSKDSIFWRICRWVLFGKY
jgi:hypothetical protein